MRDIRKLLSRKLASISHPQIKPEVVASRLKGLSHAEVERICYDAIRLCVLRDLPEVTSELFEESVEREKQRIRIIRTTDKRIKNSVKESK